MNFISIHSVLSKLNRDIGSSFEEIEAIEWAGEALGHIDAPNSWEEVVSFVKVENYRVLLPSSFKAIKQIAINTCYNGDPAYVCPSAIVPPEAAEEVVVRDCNGNVINPCDWGRYSSSYTLDAYFAWSRSDGYATCYSPLRVATGSYFSSLPMSIPDRNNLHPDNDGEYKVMYPYIQFSFQDGYVAISYTRARVDADGFPLIPDLESYREAITRYVRLKLTQRKIDNGDQVAMNLLLKYEQDWHWYCKQASNEMAMHKGLGEWENKLQRSLHQLPTIHSFSSYFGTLNQPYQQTYKEW